MSRKYNKFLTIFLIVIILAIIGLITFIVVTKVSESQNTIDGSDFVEEFKQEVKITEKNNDTTNTTATNETTNETTDSEGTNFTVENTTNSSSTGTTSTKKKQYKGFDVIGTIEIPKTDVSYPILAKVTTASLNVAVAAIWPQPEATINAVGNVVIMGHNYRNGTFFSNNKKLSNGDKIKLTGLDGTTVTYVIYKIFETTDSDTSFYTRDTDGKREVTLSTCTDNAEKRLIIQAKEQ